MARFEIVRAAEALRGHAGTALPIDAEQIAIAVGIVVRPWPLGPNLREMIYDQSIVISDREDDPVWVRFLIAHALGHHTLHVGTPAFWHALPTGDVILAQREHQADVFARALLLPAAPWLQLAPARSDTELAGIFGVPVTQVRLHRGDILAGNFDPQTWLCSEMGAQTEVEQ